LHIAAKLRRFVAALLLAAAVGHPTPVRLGASSADFSLKLDPLLQQATGLLGRSKVVVLAANSALLPSLIETIRQAGGQIGRSLPIVNGLVADVPSVFLPVLAASPSVQHVSLDRLIVGAMERTGATVGAPEVRQELGYDGTGIGVAIVDSGVTPWHDDLTAASGTSQRVDRFVDFVGGLTMPYDDYGHGTHVAGIVAGRGVDSDGARSGIAPGAHLIALKVLDGSGKGRISDVIAALDYVVAHKDELNIRVVNLSIATGVYESYNVDPLTLAAREVVRAGIVVVAAAGNNGRSPQGRTQYGGITAPGNAPWVLTVGASSHMGTVARADDTIAAFSSRGPSAVDAAAKPDVVAPGVGIESLSDPDSRLYTTRSRYLLSGTIQTAYLPYLSLSGTSMAAPVVTGTVALMIQANPSLTPNAVKAIVQYTAQVYAGYDPLTQGAGFLNTKGAVELSRDFATASSAGYQASPDWGARLIWGNRLIHGGRLSADANAWSSDVIWGAPVTLDGRSVEWGVACSAAGCIAAEGAWGWGVSLYQNVVWGLTCGGGDCGTRWATGVFGATDEGDTVVWGTTGEDTVVWGTADEDTVVWGTSCSDPSCEPVIWNR
jgi:serine protease AprX